MRKAVGNAAATSASLLSGAKGRWRIKRKVSVDVGRGEHRKMESEV